MNRKRETGFYAAAAGGGFLLQFLNGWITAGWVSLTGWKRPAGIALPQTATDWILTVLMLLILSPVVEELVFRGILYGCLRKKTGIWIAGIVTTVLFVVCHRSLTGAPAYLLFGICAWFLREKSGNAGPGILFHFCYNLCALALSCLQ